MEEPKKNIEVETYADDMAKIIGDNKNGVIKKIIQEQEEHDAEVEKKSPEHKWNKIFLYAGIALVLLTFLLVSLVFIFRQQIFSVEVKPAYVPIIFTDKTIFNELSGLTKEEVAQTISSEAKTVEVKQGGVEGIYLTKDKKIIGLRDFFKLIEAKLDQSKIEFISDNFLLGAVNEEESAEPTKNLFFLIQMRSAADIFDAMRGWEKKMFYDLHGYFGIELNTDTNYLLEKNFEDGIIQNRNARILRDNNGKIVMMYIYAENSSLIITDSETAATEIILRLASAQVQK